MLSAAVFAQAKTNNARAGRRATLSLLSVAVFLGLNVPVHANAEDPAETKDVASSTDAAGDRLSLETDFDLPAQPLGSALKQLANQAGIQILFEENVVAGRQTGALKQRMSAAQALKTLLSPTDLEYTARGQTVSVRRKIRAAAPGGNVSQGDDEHKKTELQAVVVTGSNIPTAADATTSPVTVIGAKQIEQGGVNSNTLEMLRKRLTSVTGRSNIGAANANNVNQITMGGSQISLRNLDTLVLINGRRVATNGANGIRGRSSVDVNQIPVGAVDRVEVLTDGASAIYGSDAVGGVVNFILKSNYQGFEAGSRYGSTTRDDNYDERSAYFVGGVTRPDMSVTVSGNWTKNTPLFQNERPFSQSITGRNATIAGAIGSGGVFPTYMLNPSLKSPSQTNPTGANATATKLDTLIANGTYVPATFASVAAGYDSAPYTTLLLAQEQKTALANAFIDLLDKKLTVFGSAILSNGVGFYQLPSYTQTLTAPAGSPFNPLKASFSSIAFNYLPAPIQYYERSHSEWFSGGFRGEIGEKWNWELSYTYSDNRVTQEQHNVYYKPNLARAIAGGYDAAGNPVAGGAYSRVITGYNEEAGVWTIQPALDPFARADAVNPASLQNLLGTAMINVGSKLDSTDLKFVGSAFALPAGDVGVAVGVAQRTEQVVGVPDRNSLVTGPTAARWIGASTFDPFDKSRRVDSGFAEVRLPLASEQRNFIGANALDLSLAYRMERYNDVGTSHVPKYSVRWQPFDDSLTLRSTFAKSFTAPGLYFLFGPSSQLLTTTATVPTALGYPGQANNLTTNNPNLKPSTAMTRSAGMVFSPRFVDNLTFTVDYISADQQGVVGGPGAGVTLSTTDRLGPDSPYLNNVAFYNFPGQPGSVPITKVHQLSDYLKNGGSARDIYLTSNFINLSGAKIRAFDVSVDYQLDTDLGRFDFTSAATIFQSYKFKALPEQPWYEYVGYATNGGTGQQGTIPRYRTYSTAEWSRGPWHVMVGNTFIPGVTDIGVGGDTYAHSTTIKPTPVASFTSWDLQLRYTPKRREDASPFVPTMKFALGVNNVFDRMPPAAPQAFTDSGVDPSTYGLLGRMVFASVTMDL